MFGKNLCSKAFLFGFKGKFSIERTIRKQSMVSYQWSVCNEKAGWWLKAQIDRGARSDYLHRRGDI
ncbi:MAG: hypothetical protein DB853_13170 [Candidatus Brocadia sp.]|nr:MAG: hypothetical protein DB853_13170 [Candidatus Brocadia sp.]